MASLSYAEEVGQNVPHTVQLHLEGMFRMDQSTVQKAQQWLLGIGRREEWGVTASAYPASLGGDENGLEFDTDDGSTTLSIILFKWMNFLLYELYLNKKKYLF